MERIPDEISILYTQNEKELQVYKVIPTDYNDRIKSFIRSRPNLALKVKVIKNSVGIEYTSLDLCYGIWYLNISILENNQVSVFKVQISPVDTFKLLQYSTLEKNNIKNFVYFKEESYGTNCSPISHEDPIRIKLNSENNQPLQKLPNGSFIPFNYYSNNYGKHLYIGYGSFYQLKDYYNNKFAMSQGHVWYSNNTFETVKYKTVYKHVGPIENINSIDSLLQTLRISKPALNRNTWQNQTRISEYWHLIGYTFSPGITPDESRLDTNTIAHIKSNLI